MLARIAAGQRAHSDSIPYQNWIGPNVERIEELTGFAGFIDADGCFMENGWYLFSAFHQFIGDTLSLEYQIEFLLGWRVT
jgi:hypothetical protein